MSAAAPLHAEGVARSSTGKGNDLSAALMARLRAALPFVAAVYLLLAGAALLPAGFSGAAVDGAPALATGVACLGAWMLLRRDLIYGQAVQMAAAAICGLVLVHGLRSMYIHGADKSSTIVFLILAVSGVTFYSPHWYSGVTFVCLSAWVLVARPILAPSTFYYWLAVLLATEILAGFTVYYRIWKCHRMEQEAGADRAKRPFQPEYLERAVEGTQDGLWYWELGTDEFHFSTSWAKLLGYEPAELTKSPNEWISRVHPGYLTRLQNEMAAHLHGDAAQFRNEHRIRRKDGTYLWVLARATVVRNDAGEPVVLAGSHSDITPVIEAEKRLLTDAFSDELTGLPNRTFLLSHLERSVEEKRSRGSSARLFAVAFLDLDRFKFVNDTMGHNVGDQLLKAVAARLRNCARPDDLVSRFGGDEFVILLRNLRDPEEAIRVGKRILQALSTPFQLDEQTVQSGGSIGIALSRESFSTSDEILQFGDLAMYKAKALRNGEVQLFHPSMLTQSDNQEMLRNDLKTALARNQLVLHYQPFIHTATGRIVGAEALIRWQRGPDELLYPGEFLPLAEKSGLIQEIGEWTLRTACSQNSSWQAAGASPIRMAVNLSAGQLQQRDFAERVQRILAESKLKPQYLELELNESVLMRSLDTAPETLKALSDSGIRAAIDDFGSGQASFQYLRQFPFQTMKLDRSFIADIASDNKAATVARGLIRLAHDLDLAVVAEGVERNEQFRFLSAESCDQVQGYLTGRPVPPQELFAMLRAGQDPRIVSPVITIETDLSRLRAAQGESVPVRPEASQWTSGRTPRG